MSQLPPTALQSPDVPDLRAPRNRAAMTSLINGALIFIPFLTGIVAIIAGCIGLRQSQKIGRGKASSVSGIILGASNILLWIIITVTAHNILIEQERQAASLQNFRWALSGIQAYLADHDAYLPTHFAEIVPYMNAMEWAHFPADKPHDSTGLIDHLNATYVLPWPQYTQVHRIRSTSILLYEPPTERNRHQLTVGYVDGSVRLFSANQAQAVMSELRSGHNPPRNDVIDASK